MDPDKTNVSTRGSNNYLLSHNCTLIEELTIGEDISWTRSPEENKIVFIIRGTFNLHYSGKRYNIGGGKMFILPRGAKYEAEVKKDTWFIVFCLSVGVHVIDLFPIADLPDGKSCRRGELYVLPIHEAVMSFLQTTRATIDGGADIAHYYEFKFRELVVIMKKFYSNEELTRLFCPVMDIDVEFMDFVVSNYEKVKTVKEFADLSNMSLSSFKKRFNENFGQPPYGWMKHQRCIRLLDELTQGSESFKELCDKYDFSSMSQMTTFCKTNFGKTPTQIRNEGKSSAF